MDETRERSFSFQGDDIWYQTIYEQWNMLRNLFST